jgi:hypothetical protein
MDALDGAQGEASKSLDAAGRVRATKDESGIVVVKERGGVTHNRAENETDWKAEGCRKAPSK